MDSMIIGRYLPLNSFIHKRDPRLKIGLLLLFLIAVFFDAGFIGYDFIQGCYEGYEANDFHDGFSCLIQSLILTDWFCCMYSRTC